MVNIYQGDSVDFIRKDGDFFLEKIPGSGVKKGFAHGEDVKLGV